MGSLLGLAVLIAAAPLASSTRYDPRIPTLLQVVGHEPGAAISSPEQIAAYLAALARAAPERTQLVEYARSEQGRPLHVLAIGSAARLAPLADVRAGLRRLAEPRGLAAAEADRLIAELPVVVWLLHAVHGNEISSSDAALTLAYHLLAAEDDPAAETVLREAIVLVDPLQNPDGRARFLASFAAARGSEPDPEPLAAEHDEPWPGGRSNHYLFDMNRDWFALTQPETRGRLGVYLEWFPHVTVDLHEMGGESTYYFAPPADPLNPHISQAQRGWFERLGRAIGERFDRAGVAYFVREIFDSFYPGYGESWPLFHGSVGMTFEQASARGLVWRREDEALLTYADGIHNHFTAALATAETAARQRQAVLRDFLEYRRAAVREGERGPVREYVLAPGPDPARPRRLASLLAGQGVEVKVAQDQLRVGGRTLPAGSYVVPLAQPAGRLARNLLDPEVTLDPAFVTEQDRRRRKRLPGQIYDVTAWSLPLLFGVECVASDRASGGGLRAFSDEAAPDTSLAQARVAYLMPWGSGTAAAAIEALRQGLKLRVAEAAFTLAGRAYPAGTLVARVESSRPSWQRSPPAITPMSFRRTPDSPTTASRSAATRCARREPLTARYSVVTRSDHS